MQANLGGGGQASKRGCKVIEQAFLDALGPF